VLGRTQGRFYSLTRAFPALRDLCSSQIASFELNKGTTLAQAEKIAEYLNNNIELVPFTLFGDHPMFAAIPPDGK
jgi:hypothetical protein